ncbi:MAG TPA: NADH-quinone oxidoreductase subunit NuoE [Candidatus Omnitrophota bacterium]|nr:NADH-quinone oxidoreductase subunit NuoE [Candidatus Omnitrophota bacterium]HPS20046.1 NADH-quinone oxidoreductase subunit NuoE [Candidatus Omnitrophota bacterium]
MNVTAGLDKNKLDELKKYMELRKKEEYKESYLIDILHKAQGIFGYLNPQVMDEISAAMNIPTAHIWGVATFYHYFKLKPCGKYIISVCLGTACYVKGAEDVLATVKKELGIELGQTTQDMLFTLQETRCLGACGLAPVMMINDKIYGELTRQKVTEIIKDLRQRG